MKEIQDLIDALPYWLLFVLPLFIALSPYSPCDASELHFPIHRLAQFEISGNRFGSKTAAISIEARSSNAASTNLLRKVVIAKLTDISVSKLNDILTSGAGGVLLLIPKDLSPESKESVQALEEYLLSTEIEVPVYFTDESEDLDYLVDNLQSVGNEKTASAAQALFSNIASNGYQMVSSTSANPRIITDLFQTSIESTLRGRSDDDAIQTVVVVAHYDAHAPAPGRAFGSDSNGSGVTILLELARIFGRLYRDTKTRPQLNLVLLLSAAGKWNYFGSKRWLEDHLDQNANSELLSDVAFVLCLDTLGGGSGRKQLHMHVSKPPKDDTHAGKFYANLQAIARQLKDSSIDPEVKMIHKKINLADEILAWEHERFSIRRMPAFTLSQLNGPSQLDRATIFDQQVDQKVILDNTKVIAEALLCTLYNLKTCTGQFFVGSLAPQAKPVNMWTEYFARTPRYAGLMTSAPATKKSNSEPGVVDILGQSMMAFTNDVRYLKSKTDKQDPEFIFYDLQDELTMTAHNVKPAVFDLLLTCAISGYLGLVYLFLIKSGTIINYISTVAKSDSVHSSPAKTNGFTNGHHKIKAN